MTVWTLGGNRSGRNVVEMPLPVLFERLMGDGMMWVSRTNGGLFSLSHLWFLYYLLLLYALVLGARWLLTRSDGVANRLRRRADAWLAGAVKSPGPLVGLVLLTGLLLWPMRLWFGVDLPAWTLIPLPPVLATYAVFFVVGWLLHRQAHLLGQLARHWRWQLPTGLLLSVALFAAYHAMERHGAIQMGTYPTLEVSQVLDWPAFLARLKAAESASQVPPELASLWRQVPRPAREAILRLTDDAGLDARAGVLQVLMGVLIHPAALGAEPIAPGPRPPPGVAFPALAANRITLERLMDGALVGDLRQLPWYGPAKLAYSIGYSLVTWLLVVGTLGFFQARCPAHSPAWRYVADSSYWIYLAHLPLVAALQVWLAQAAWPGLIKFALINVIAFPVLFASYHYLVRSTVIGRVLNGQSHPFVAWPFASAANARTSSGRTPGRPSTPAPT
jgi:peptidoglycan/LPS O-acetylase OafA/YrhL